MVVAVRAGVEVAGVVGAVQLRHELGLVAQQVVPVQVEEEAVVLDLGSADRAQPLQRVVGEQARDQVFGVGGHVDVVVVVGPAELVVDDAVEEVLGRGAVEGRHRREELVENDAHGPPVYCFAVALAQDHLGR